MSLYTHFIRLKGGKVNRKYQNYQACVSSRSEIFERGEKYLRFDKKASTNAEG